MFKLVTKVVNRKFMTSVKFVNVITCTTDFSSKVIGSIPDPIDGVPKLIKRFSLCKFGVAKITSNIEIHVPVIWVLGGPGSGKGTQCEKIVKKYGFTHLSSGDLLRLEVDSGSPRGKDIVSIMESGGLVPLEIVLDILRDAMLKSLATATGFLIDGYPREKEQGILFEQNVAAVDVILFFDAPEEVLVDRLLGRAKTSGRVDDNLETIKNRLQTFKQHADAIANHYTLKIKKIDAVRSPEEIFAEVETYLDPLVK